MINMENVYFKYDDKGHYVLNNINLQVKESEFVFVIGPSGAGKSSLIKLITLENKAYSGKIIVNKRDLSELKKREVPYFKRSIGMVFQDFRLIPHLNVFDNVAFVLRVTNCSAKYIKKRVPIVLEMVKISHKANKLPNELSGGEQQRVAIARALASNPQLLIADEPTGNVDPNLSYEIIKILSDINKYLSVTMMLVTHEHELVKKFNKRVISINSGKIEFDKIAEVEEVAEVAETKKMEDDVSSS